MSVQNPPPPQNECDAIIDLIADYAFGLTDAEETRRVEAGLPGCPEAQQQLAEFRLMQDELREDTPAIEPPAALRNRLLQMIDEQPAAPSAHQPRAPQIHAPAQPVLTPPPAKRAIHPAWWAAAAAVLLLVVTNVYWFTRSGATVPDSEAFSIASASNVRRINMPAAEPFTGTVLLVWDTESATGLMYALDLPALADGRVYELWLARNGVRTSVGKFEVDESGAAILIFSGEDLIDNYGWAWLTEESSAPDTPPSDIVVADSAI